MSDVGFIIYFILFILLLIYGIKKLVKQMREKTLEDIEQEEAFEKELVSNGFIISKVLKNIDGKTLLFVDDVNKKWIVKDSKSTETSIYDYADIAKIEIFENTFVYGEVTRQITNILQVHIYLNNLKNSETAITIFNTRILNSSKTYKMYLEVAKNIEATLLYMQNQVETEVKMMGFK